MDVVKASQGDQFGDLQYSRSSRVCVKQSMRTCHDNDMKEEMKHSKLKKKKCRAFLSGQKESKHLLLNSEEGSPFSSPGVGCSSVPQKCFLSYSTYKVLLYVKR